MERDLDGQASAPDSDSVSVNHMSPTLQRDGQPEAASSIASKTRSKTKIPVFSTLWDRVFTGDSTSGDREDKRTVSRAQVSACSISESGSIKLNQRGSADHGYQYTQSPSSATSKPVGDTSGSSACHSANNQSRMSKFTSWLSRTSKDVLQHPTKHPATGHKEDYTTEIFECADKIEEEVTTLQCEGLIATYTPQNATASDSLKQALSKNDELHARYTSSMRKISKLEKEVKEVKKLNQLLTERLKQNGISVDLEVAHGSGEEDKLGENDKIHEHQARAFELSEKDEEIRILRERCETRYQQIKTYEQQNAELGKQSKHFEVEYHLELQENQSLKAQIQSLRDQLNGQFVDDTVLDEDNLDESSTEYRKAINSLKAEVKRLNDDLSKLQDHSKDQSRQILLYKQQAQVTEMMEGQMKSMEGMLHEAEAKCDQLHQKLKSLNQEVKPLKDEKKAADRQAMLLTQEVSRMMKYQSEMQELREKYSEVVCERDNVIRSLQAMGDLSAQQAQSEKKLDAITLEKNKLQEHVQALNAQIAVYRNDFEVERRDREEAHSQIADLQKEIARYEEESGSVTFLKNQLAEHQQSLSSVELVNKKLHQEVKLTRARCQELEQDMLAKSSQVKQYAKEVERLKQQLGAVQSGIQTVENGCSRAHDSLPDEAEGGTGFARLNDILKTTEDDNQRLSHENFDLYNQVEELKRVNTHLTEQLSSLSNKVQHVNYGQSAIQEVTQQEGVPQELSSSASRNKSEGLPSLHLTQQANDTESQLTVSAPQQVILYSTDTASTSQSLPNQFITPESLGNISAQQPINDSCESHSSSSSKALPLSKPLPTDEGEVERVVSDSPPQVARLPISDSSPQDIHSKIAVEDSITQFENPLQKELDDEIHQQAAEVIQEVSRGRQKIKTDLQRPFDPNLVCPMCRRKFRIGEIQKFRRHVNTCTGTDDD